MTFYSISETAITIQLGELISDDVHKRVMLVRDAIAQRPFTGFTEVVAAYTTVTVFYDPVKVMSSASGYNGTPSKKVTQILKQIVAENESVPTIDKSAVHNIPVCYENEFALDIAWLADYHRITSEEIINRHTAGIYKVFMIGFAPGFPYLGILPESLESPRKQNPRLNIPAGSVGLAGRQTGIYPFDTPGGWQIIGRTPLRLFNPALPSPSLLNAGDKVRFERISVEQFDQLSS